MRGRVALVAFVTLVLVTGCTSGGSNKAGGQREPKPVVLTLANAITDPLELVPFVDEVTRLSGGAIRIEVQSNWRTGQVRYENGLIRDVRAGKADLGWAGSRAWDSVGVNGFRALNAPFLVDSYALEERVVRGPLVKPMLGELGRLGLVGLGVVSGPMRRPLGIRRPLVEPRNFAGLTVAVQQSRIADATMRALGADAVWIPVQADIRRFGGAELQVSGINGAGYDRFARYLTANVNFWPRPLVLFANRRAFHRLTPEEQSVLRRAATNVVSHQIALDRRLDREASDDICRGGFVSFETASPAELAALRRAAQPVYDQLETDPGTRVAIRAIEGLKHAMRVPPDSLRACRRGHAQAVGQPTPIDGVWRMTTKFGETSHDPTLFAENYGTWTFVFDRGRFAVTQQYKDACTWGYGRFRVNGQETAWTFTDGGGIAPNGAYDKPGEFFRFGWSRYRDTLKLTPVKGAISPENFRAKPWHLISSTPSRRFLNSQCPPPTRALTR
jgi:TRAP-type C4-dicarboxylate transport system substrate-binding protein